jgi:hypothetical protein
VTVENSTLSANSVLSRGVGGILLDGGPLLTITIRNNTISGNNGGPNGVGAIANQITTTSLITLSHNTIVSNTAAGAGVGISTTTGSTITLSNNIIANNSAANCAPSGTLIFHGLNIQNGDGSCVGGASVSQGDPNLGPLRDNGGPVQTHAILFPSPALDAAPALYCPPTDARGAPRPSGTGCDIGAFERTVPTLTTITPSTTVVSLVSLTVQLAGTSFLPGATALVDGSPRATSFISSTLLTATLVPLDTMTVRVLQISGQNPGQGEGPTASLPFSVTTSVFVPNAPVKYLADW